MSAEKHLQASAVHQIFKCLNQKKQASLVLCWRKEKGGQAREKNPWRKEKRMNLQGSSIPCELLGIPPHPSGLLCITQLYMGATVCVCSWISTSHDLQRSCFLLSPSASTVCMFLDLHQSWPPKIMLLRRSFCQYSLYVLRSPPVMTSKDQASW